MANTRISRVLADLWGKGVAKSMGIGGQNFGLAAVMTEQGAQPGRGHGLAWTGALEGNEQVEELVSGLSTHR